MIKTNYGMIKNDAFCGYLDFLINRVFKILPLKESGDELEFKKYIEKLMISLVGNSTLISEIKSNDGYFIELMNNIEYLGSQEYTHDECKSIVFDSITLVKKLISRYELDSELIEGDTFA